MSTLLPPNSTALERAVEAATRLDMDVPIADLWNPDTCPEQALPWLAWALHVTDDEGWRLAPGSEQKRALLSQAIVLHRKKGTPWSIRQTLLAAGFNGLDIVEQLPQDHYDGTVNHTGAQYYNAYGWAQFRVTADVGDAQPISAANTQRMVQTINEFKPERCHLVDVQYRASVTETLPSADATTTAAQLAQDESHLWGQRLYDGSLAFDQGLLCNHEGAFAFDGSVVYAGFSSRGELFDSRREADDMTGALSLYDVQSHTPLFDGLGDYGGSLDFGASAPAAQELPMPMVLVQHRRYDGRRAFAQHCYDGRWPHAGGFTYFGNVAYTGDVLTTLEA